MRPRKKRNTGYVLLLLALGMTMLCGFAGLALDLGFAEYYKRRAQAAADAGAIGAIQEVRMNGSTNAVSAAKQDVTTNGFTDGTNNATVTVNMPPTSGAYNGKSDYVEVIVTKKVPTSFMGMLNQTSVTVYARSVGGLGAGPYCILALDPSAAKALQVTGSTSVSLPNCAVMTDSNANGSGSGAAMYDGSAAGSITAKDIDVVGTWGGNGTVSPAPTTGVPYVYDPLSQLAAPTVASCPSGGVKKDASGNNLPSTITSNITLNPGTYCGGLKITGGTVTFNAGVYVLNGGGMQVSGGAALTGTGVTFYNTGSGNGATKYGDIQMTGTGPVTLSAPTTGGQANYEGILIFQDRTLGTTGGNGDVIQGNQTGSHLNGVIYVPKGLVTYTGNMDGTGYQSIVADEITFTGNSTLASDYSTLADGNPLQTGVLSE